VINFENYEKNDKKIEAEIDDLKAKIVTIKETIKDNIQKVDDLKKGIEAIILKFQIPSRELMKTEKL
jgi:peptidoglycan hydrolase CwlO-like protein